MASSDSLPVNLAQTPSPALDGAAAPHAEPLGRLNGLVEHLQHEIRGQDDVIPRVTSVLRRGELGLTHAGRPRGSFLFLGPTGVGKTEITLQFTNHLFGPGRMFRFDMSEYQSPDSVKLLLGADREDHGRFGAVMAQADSGTLLFDEMEKADKRVLDLFLQITDAARVTVATGQTLDFTNFYIVFTSNLASAEILRMERAPYASLERHVLTKASQSLRPEFFARISEKLVFRKLSYDIQLQVADLLIQKELRQLAAKGFHLTAGAGVTNFLIAKGYHPYFGARPLRGVIEKYMQDAVAEELLKGGSGSGALSVDGFQDRLCLQPAGLPTGAKTPGGLAAMRPVGAVMQNGELGIRPTVPLFTNGE